MSLQNFLDLESLKLAVVAADQQAKVHLLFVGVLLSHSLDLKFDQDVEVPLE